MSRKRAFISASLTADGVPATIDLDFVNNVRYENGRPVGDAFSRCSVSRASQAYAQDISGNWISFASGVPRRTNKGLLVEIARTNLYVNSTGSVTQNVSVTSGTVYTVSVVGGGSVTLSGTSGATGTVTQINPITFTSATTGATLTVTGTGTVTGTFKNVQVEAGYCATSPIITGAGSATRASDVILLSPFTPFGVNYSIYGHGYTLTGLTPAQAEVLIAGDNGSGTDRIIIYGNQTPNLVMQISAASTSLLTQVVGSWGNAVPHKGMLAYAAGNQAAVLDGTVQVDTITAGVPAAFTELCIGNHVSGLQWNGYIVRAAAWTNTRVSNGAMRLLTRLRA